MQYDIGPDQELPLFGAGRPQVPTAVVVNAAVRRRVAAVVHFLRVFDVDLFVVHL